MSQSEHNTGGASPSPTEIERDPFVCVYPKDRAENLIHCRGRRLDAPKKTNGENKQYGGALFKGSLREGAVAERLRESAQGRG